MSSIQQVLLNINYQPKHLVIVGGGYIALEFASMFANLGSKVTVLERGETFMPREDQDVVAHAITDLENKALHCIQMLKRLNCHLTIIIQQSILTLVTLRLMQYFWLSDANRIRI